MAEKIPREKIPRLTLLIFEPNNDQVTNAITTLPLASGIFLLTLRVLEKQKGVFVPPKFMTLLCIHAGRVQYGNTQRTALGNRMRYVRVEDLLPYEDSPDVQESYVNRAVWAFLNALPPTMCVALYWSQSEKK